MTILAVLLFLPLAKSIMFPESFAWVDTALNVLIIAVAASLTVLFLGWRGHRKMLNEFFYVCLGLFCLLVAPIGLINENQNITQTLSQLLSAAYHTLFCFALGMILSTNPRTLVRSWAWISTLLCLANVITIVLLPEGLYSVTRGVITTPYWLFGYDNTHINLYLLSLLMVALSTFLDAGRCESSLLYALWVLYLGISIYLKTMTSLLSLVVFGVLIISLSHFSAMQDFFSATRCSMGVLCASALLLATVPSGASGILGRVAADVLGKDVMFNSRGYIWANYIDAIIQRPVFGYGYQTLQEMQQVTGFLGAHNEWLQMEYVGGIVHLGFYCLMLFNVVKRIDCCKKNSLKALLVALLTSLMIVETMVPLRQYVWMAFFVIAYCCDSVADYQSHSARRKLPLDVSSRRLMPHAS